MATLTQAAQALGLSYDAMRQLAHSGEIPAKRIGRIWDIDLDAITPSSVLPPRLNAETRSVSVKERGAGGVRQTGGEAGEVGFTGTIFAAGRIYDDYNHDLQWPRSIDTYDRMRRSDTQVQAIETVISQPIRTVRYYVQPADDSADAHDAADLVERNLLRSEWMSHTWDDLLRQALTSVMLGFAIFEKVVEEHEGQLVYRKLAPRHPRTLYKWAFDDAGGVNGIIQQGQVDGKFITTDLIPSDKLLRFTYREEFGNPEGFPLCRPMYRDWHFKDAALRIAGIGIERDWVGTPLGKSPAGASEKDRQDFLAGIQKLTTHENSGMVLPNGYELDSFHGGTKSGEITAFIDARDMAMSRCALAAFLNIVGQQRGSSALSADQAQFFLLASEAHADWLCSIINQHAVRPLCDWNWPGLREYPRICHAALGSVLQPTPIAHALAALVNKSLITPDLTIEDAVREMMSLPEIPEDQRTLYEEALKRRLSAPPPPVAPPNPNAPSNPSDPASASRAVDPRGAGIEAHSASVSPAIHAVPPCSCGLHASDVTPYSPVGKGGQGGLGLNLDRIRAEIFSAEDRFGTEGRALLEKMISSFEKSAGAIVDAAAKSDDLSRGKHQLALADLKMTLQPKYKAWLRDFLMGIVDLGAAAAADETGQPLPAIPNELRSFVTAQAQILTKKHMADLEFVAINQAQRDLDARLGRDTVMANVRTQLREQSNQNLQASLADAIRAVTDQLSACLAAAFTPSNGGGDAGGSAS